MAVFNGTAAELAELTRKHWEADWWPKHEDGPLLVWPVCSDSDPRGTWLEWIPGQDVTTAASIIFSAAMVWLARKGQCPCLAEFVNGWEVNGVGFVCVSCRSPLHAVLAALEVVS